LWLISIKKKKKNCSLSHLNFKYNKKKIKKKKKYLKKKL